MSEIEVKIEKDHENKLVGRREIECTISYAGATPSRDALKNELVHKLALNPKTTVVVKIEQKKGAMLSRAVVHAYASEEALKAEQKHLLERGVKKEEKPKEEAKSTANASEEATRSEEAK